MPHFPYVSYNWSIGTTSFRTVDFNVRIERQLAMLDEFWTLRGNKYESWNSNNELQREYYFFMQERDFLVGEAPRPDKDARQKTSGLVDIGLINDERKLSDAGRVLLQLIKNGNFTSDNFLQIPKDSYIYLKQLLKTSIDVHGDIIRPYVITAYALLRLGYLTNEEFTYLLPLCTTRENTEEILNSITSLRNGIGSIDEIIISRLMSMENYKSALDYFVSEYTTENVIIDVGMNRKSRIYDKPYYLFYTLLRKLTLKHDETSLLPLLEQSFQLSGKPGILWRQYLFKTIAKRKLGREGLTAMNDVLLLRASTEDIFQRLFFERMHLFKAKANLSDYADLNQRYLKTTDTVIFSDGKVELDVLPRCWLFTVTNDLLNIAFSISDNLYDNVDLLGIAPFLTIDERLLQNNLQQLYGVTVTTATDVVKAIHDYRYKRFNSLINERFNRAVLIDMLNKFERREDNDIRQAVTNNADIPTIFEYIIGIAWYLISDRRGDVLNYMNLSLEADLLPRSHAAGGSADIEYLYEQTPVYPEHTLLLEATLTDNANQRRQEIEPVSRHLGDYILLKNGVNSYCVFVSTFLHHNVISDFRNRRTYQHFSDQFENVVNGLKIIPLATVELRKILEDQIKYDRLYALFESAYHSDEPVPSWYVKNIISYL